MPLVLCGTLLDVMPRPHPTLRLIFLACLGLAASAQAEPATSAPAAPPLNVLFIISDDLRTETGAYGIAGIRTPHLDALASRSTLFERAYVQYPLCNPSRASLLTGRYPTQTGVLNNRQWWGHAHPDWRTLPRYFRDHGYLTLRAGKIFHKGIDDASGWVDGGEPRVYPDDATEDIDPATNAARGQDPAVTAASNARSDRIVVVPGDGAELPDYVTANLAIEHLRRAKAADAPFFVACGFVNPHSPPTAPQSYFDLYDAAAMTLPDDFASRPALPAGFPALSVVPYNTDLFINREATAAQAREMKRAYWAATSFMDAQAGRVLAALDELGLRDNTIVVFWGDHGYHLGEKGRWSKAYSLFEVAARAPFFIAVPHSPGNGRAVAAPVELVGLYRTLTELCGLPDPGTAGASLVPLLRDPNLPWDRPAYTLTTYDGKIGRSVRTARWRYTEWTYGRDGAVLFDEVADPHERTNLAADPAHAATVAQLRALLHAFPGDTGPQP